jgi:hypothetical protein
MQKFNGPDLGSDDEKRLSKQHERIRDLMLDGQWRTLPEIENLTGFPQASISAQLRHLRKERFGSYTVDRRRRDSERLVYEYRVQVPAPDKRQLVMPFCGDMGVA